MKYRPEIDGLRAVAVMLVFLYHAGLAAFKGGFIGVDIFFVISGFLITTIILKDLDQDRFSYADFYERRARRILPTLFLVMLTSLPFAWHLLLPEALKEYGRSLVATIFFGSNIQFWLEASSTPHFKHDGDHLLHLSCTGRLGK
jgi:peptidoglycan/LPS O-acetylase OafA/YrhL